MKTLISGLLFICIVSIHAQDRLNKISVNPIQLIGYNRLNLEFERGFDEGKYGIAFYLGQTGMASRLIHEQYSYLSEQNVSLRFYRKTIHNSCFWYGITVSVSSGKISAKNGTASNLGALAILGTSGYQFIIKSLVINPYLSAGYAITNDLFGSAIFTGDIDQPGRILLTYGLKAGYCF